MIFLFIVPVLAGLRELPRAAHDRREGHGVPAPERDVVLVLPGGRARPHGELLRRRRPRAGRLVRLPAALRARATCGMPYVGQDLWILGDPPDDDLVDRGRDQPHRHDPQHARAGDDLDAHPALRLDDRDVRDPPRPDAPGRDRGGDAAPLRPPGLARASSCRRRAGARCSTSTCSGSSGTPRST